MTTYRMMMIEESCVVHNSSIFKPKHLALGIRVWKKLETDKAFPETDGSKMVETYLETFILAKCLEVPYFIFLPARIWYNKLGSGDCQATAE